VEVLRSLEDGLSEYPGCAIIVSHDRWFLDRVCTHILAFETDGVLFYEGSYSQYEEFMKHKAEKEGKAPKKFVFTNIHKTGSSGI
jgi:ATPase subunit of ABC transporter with duplicated ATPase domains